MLFQLLRQQKATVNFSISPKKQDRGTSIAIVIVKRGMTIKREQSRIKQGSYCNNSTGSNREKSNIVIAILENGQLDTTIIVSFLKRTNTFIADCRYNMIR